MAFSIPIRTALFRSLRLRCPRCGKGKTLRSWFAHRHQCSECGLIFASDPIDLGMFMYVSTAAFTGAFLIGYFLIGFPVNTWARVCVGGAGLALMVLTAPLRRSLGIGLIYAAEILFAPDKADQNGDAGH